MGKYLDSIGLSHFMSLIKQALAGKSDTGHTHSGYQLEGNYWTASKDGTSYWGAHFPNGTSNDWMRTPQSGIIPYASGGASSDCGTSTWPFKNIYGKTVYQNGTKVSVEGHTHSQYYDSGLSRTANTVLAAPNGSAGSASFRALVAADIPSLAASKITSGTFDVARLSSARTHRTSHGNIDAVTTAPTAAAVGSWNYDKYSDGLVHAWGIIRTQNQGITTSLGTGFYWNATEMYVALPVAAKFIMNVQYGYSMGGSQTAGAYLISSGSTSNWSTGTQYCLRFHMARPISGSSGTYWFPVDVWYMAA